MKSSTEKYMSMEFKKFHNKILKHMKTFGVTIDHILDHFIGSKLWLYVLFRIPLYIKNVHYDPLMMSLEK